MENEFSKVTEGVSYQEQQKLREQYKNDLLKKLDDFGIRLDSDKKEQHLIVNPEVIDDLVEFGDINSSDTVLEIGSGPGNITEKLAKHAGRVYAVEIDKRFQPLLESLKSENQNIEVLIGDFLHMKLPSFNKIVANPPFHILEPMIQRFAKEQFELASLVIGERYYYRVMARPGLKEFTKTSLFTQGSFNAELAKKLEKNDFYPKSKEKTVIMKLVSHEGKVNPILKQIATFFSETAEKKTSFLVESICSQFGMPRGKITSQNYDQIVTSSSLSISHSVLSKRLQELSNNEISQLTEKLLSVRKPLRREENL